MRKKLSILCCLFVLLFLFPAGSLAARIWQPATEREAQRLALSLFCQCAFHPEYPGSSSPSLLNRWDQEITVWLGGNPTAEDRAFADGFLQDLNEKVPGLPGIRRVRMDSAANIRIWYVGEYMLPHYIDGYVDGNWGFFHYDYRRDRITSARIGIASDVTDQETRNHLFMEELVGALGLPGDHAIYADSILYDPWTVTQELSDVDWRMLNLLYSPALSPGMTEAQVRDALQ